LNKVKASLHLRACRYFGLIGHVKSTRFTGGYLIYDICIKCGGKL